MGSILVELVDLFEITLNLREIEDIQVALRSFFDLNSPDLSSSVIICHNLS